jgi:1,4-alpha-glucan branching enzyme
MAACVVGIFAAGAAAGFVTQRTETVRAASMSRADSVQVVRFVFVDSAARSVALVGDFNAWTKGATQLLPTGRRGTWVASVPLTLGRHEYAFIVDGTRWVADPFATTLHDEFGTESSVVMLGKQG